MPFLIKNAKGEYFTGWNREMTPSLPSFTTPTVHRSRQSIVRVMLLSKEAATDTIKRLLLGGIVATAEPVGEPITEDEAAVMEAFEFGQFSSDMLCPVLTGGVARGIAPSIQAALGRVLERMYAESVGVPVPPPTPEPRLELGVPVECKHTFGGDEMGPNADKVWRCTKCGHCKAR